MLKILIVSPLALENGRGGELSSIELAEGLSKYFKVTLIDTNIIIGKKLLNKKEIKTRTQNVIYRPKLKYATLSLFRWTFTFPFPWEIFRLNHLIKKNDIIYASNSTIKNNLLLFFFKVINRNKKFIIGHRAPLYSQRIFSLYNFKQRISILIFSFYKEKFFHHTISFHAKKFLENFFPPRNIFHIIHGVSFKLPKETLEVKKNQDFLKFIYVGHLDDVHKGVGILLEAIQKLLSNYKDLLIKFEFCGEGPLKNKILMLKNLYPERIIYEGYIPNDKISFHYALSDIFLFTSRREPFGRVLIEALGGELIIICTKTIGSVEILKNKKFAYFINLNVQEICEKILEIYMVWENNYNQFRDLQKKAKIYARQNFSLSNEIGDFKILINNISKI